MATILPFTARRLPHGLHRFLRYVLIGGATFGLDMSLLLIATRVLHLPYPPVVFGAFFVGVSISYVLNRRLVFTGSHRSFWQGYLNMAGVAALGASLTTSLTVALTESLGLNFLLSRIAVAALIGAANYFFNLYVNFRVAGRHTQAEILTLTPPIPQSLRA